jgi:Domain of unknown function (DUF3291)
VRYELAEVNVFRLRAPLDSATMRGFAAAADPVYRLAESTPGFRWRLPGPHRVVADGPSGQLVSVSVWDSYEALHAFTYRSLHGGLLRRRAEWFLPTPQPSTALWWVSAGDRPTVEEALRRLAFLRRYGPTAQAFGVRRRFGPDGRPVIPGPVRPPVNAGPRAGAAPWEARNAPVRRGSTAR